MEASTRDQIKQYGKLGFFFCLGWMFNSVVGPHISETLYSGLRNPVEIERSDSGFQIKNSAPSVEKASVYVECAGSCCADKRDAATQTHCQIAGKPVAGTNYCRIRLPELESYPGRYSVFAAHSSNSECGQLELAVANGKTYAYTVAARRANWALGLTVGLFVLLPLGVLGYRRATKPMLEHTHARAIEREYSPEIKEWRSTSQRLLRRLSMSEQRWQYLVNYQRVWVEYFSEETENLPLSHDDRQKLFTDFMAQLGLVALDVFQSSFPIADGVCVEQLRALKHAFDLRSQSNEIDESMTFGEFLAVHEIARRAWKRCNP